MQRPSDRNLIFIVCAVLAVLTLGLYWPVRHNEFINYDDNDYVYENPHVLAGLTWDGARWAFTTNHSANWHPLTWLSLMLDCQLFGSAPGALQLVNVFYHTVNSVLLFLLLRRLTGALWPSAFVAALFAWHPLHVQSVAWIAERKDVLSTLFWLLTTWTYARFVEGSKVQGPKSKVFHGLALICFALGLMAKPMLVTLPFTLVLLDVWPLRRWQPTPQSPAEKRSTSHSLTLRDLLVEKWPFFLLSAASSVVTFLVQRERAVLSLEYLSFGERVTNAAISYVRYLGKMLWPADLAVIYSLPHGSQVWNFAGASALLVALSVLAWRWQTKRPYWPAGWLWFLGTLVPVIGLVQVGKKAMADRYTYVPLTGVFVMIAWGTAELANRSAAARWSVALAAGVALIACLVRTRLELRFWHDTKTLFSRAVEATRDNEIAHFLFGKQLFRAGDYDGAVGHLRTAIRLDPRLAEPYYVLAAALANVGRYEEAIAQYREAILRQPDDPNVFAGLAMALSNVKRYDEAAAQYRQALQLKPDLPEARHQLAVLLAAQGKFADALPHFAEAARLKPGDAQWRYQFAVACAKAGHAAESVQQYREVLRLKPDWPEALNGFARLLATHPQAEIRSGAEAVRMAERAFTLTQNRSLELLDTLAACYAETGRFAEAAAAQERVVAMLKLAGATNELPGADQRLALYRAGQPAR
ncbi:MAG: tetratricopeptide repeat protein, partial [Verrucomicrobia bacterium]|nr:tetratricopeptide repeat protein [Verrucomicrobiota bacterium]